jgi:hypothetical protein
MEEYKLYIYDYEISNLGNIRRKTNSGNYKVISGSIINCGYKYFQLQRDGKRTNHLVHHAVAKLFIDDRPENLVIDHIDRNKLNNNVSNLRYITQKENCFNQDRVISSIPQNEEDRKKKVVLLWSEKNRDVILQKKRDYYEKNKDVIQQKEKEKRNLNRITLTCTICNHSYKIQKSKKTNDNYICGSCNSREQLKKINCKL